MREEWGEIYGNLKSEIEEYQCDIKLLNNENDKLLKLTESNKSKTKSSDMEIQKKLGKRELECSALWDTIRDLYKGHSIPTDKKSLEKLFAVRALEIKARRKIFK